MTKTPHFLQPGRRVRWHTRITSDDPYKVRLADYAAVAVKRGPPGWWFIQLAGEDETRRVRVTELVEDYLIPDLLPDCLPSPWTQNRLELEDTVPIPVREPEIDWNKLDIPF